MDNRPEKELTELDKQNMNSIKDKVKIQILLSNTAICHEKNANSNQNTDIFIMQI